ncbi:Hpt domain-containing protein [Colwellia piezophila]|uniref:Hpt domain-containing protein n=1 Tax=Colwellia piezophila TaxID=211668 RepID=UPI00036DED34|nr:Hpt domain-containing protein [Colwellia piezophila]
MGKKKLLKELVASFNDASSDKDNTERHQNIQLITHTIKGVAGNLGGILLQESANQLEQAAKQQTGNY